MIPVSTPSLGKKELEYITDAVETNWISSKGGYIESFEKKFAEYCGVKYGIATNTGTAALHLALVCLGIGKGDEVIVPNFTMISSALAVQYTGATPVFIDAEEDTWNIDASKIEDKINKNTKAIMPVHIYGHPCDMDKINKLAEKYKLFVIEDAAEAHGAEYNKKKAGSLGDVGCFSFYANKLITTGEGGMIVTNDKKIYDRAKSLRDLAFGDEQRFLHKEVGFNYRMTNMQAAIGVGQMTKIDKFLDIKRKNAKYYSHLLKRLKTINLPVEKKVKNSYWMYGITIKENSKLSRDEIRKKLYDEGIDTRDFFMPMNEQPFFKHLQSDEDFPVSKKLSQTGLYLPSGLSLNKKVILDICNKLKGLYE